MATAAFMEDSSHRTSRGGPLGVNKSSKIAKIRRNTTASNQRPPPTVYKTEPEGFRSLVQELTGPNSSVNPARINNRLQSRAPPPLSAPAVFKNTPFYTPSFSPKFEFSPKFAFSPLTFSPLADLTPRDNVWASGLESPGTADIRSFAQLVGADEPKTDRTESFTFEQPPKLQSNLYGLSEFNFAGL